MSFSLKGKQIKPVFKLWFEIGDRYVFGEGVCGLLDEIQRRKSISAAAKATKMSYRYAWGLTKEVEKHLGVPIIVTQKGGRSGGKSELTSAGISLLTNYKKLKNAMRATCKLE